MKRAFTLIELLVVIAIIAILAAILFPVFAQAKLQAKKASDLSNTKQILLASAQYTNDNDDVVFSQADPCADSNGNIMVCSQYTAAGGGAAGLDTTSGEYLFWVYKLQPYSHNFGVFKDTVNQDAFTADTLNQRHLFNVPEAKGEDWGGQNSYAYNSFFLSPATGKGTLYYTYAPASDTAPPRIAGTAMFVDATFHIAGPDVTNNSGFTNESHLLGTENAWMQGAGQTPYALNYWMNIGGGDYTYQNDPGSYYAKAVQLGLNFFTGKPNVGFMDGHSKAMDYRTIVGDVCYWSIDQEGTHANCNN